MSTTSLRRLPIALALSCALTASGADEKPFVPVTDKMLQNPDPGDWLMWRRTLNSWGYSPLEQIGRASCRERV